MSGLSVPSNVSTVAVSSTTLMLYDTRDRVFGSVSATSVGDVVLRLDVGTALVARGDLYSPTWRSWLATDYRLAFSNRKEDRTKLLRLLSDVAAKWDKHREGDAHDQ